MSIGDSDGSDGGDRGGGGGGERKSLGTFHIQRAGEDMFPTGLWRALIQMFETNDGNDDDVEGSRMEVGIEAVEPLLSKLKRRMVPF